MRSPRSWRVYVAADRHRDTLIDLLVLFFIPCRLAVLYLAWAFDYLPHNGLHHKPAEDKLQDDTQSRRARAPAVADAAVPELPPGPSPAPGRARSTATSPVWRRNEDAYLEGDPALSTVRGRELTADEYRQMRELVEHHH